MTQAENKLVSALQERLAEVERERSWLKGKLAEYGAPAPENRSLFPVRALREVARGQPFAPNPNSRTSRMLEEARNLVENAPNRRLTFLDLFGSLPEDVIPPTKNGREITRKLLRESGHRVGLVYVSADMITLRDSPHLASAG